MRGVGRGGREGGSGGTPVDTPDPPLETLAAAHALELLPSGSPAAAPLAFFLLFVIPTHAGSPAAAQAALPRITDSVSFARIL